jgi:hypothetical protein
MAAALWVPHPVKPNGEINIAMTPTRDERTTLLYSVAASPPHSAARSFHSLLFAL